MNSEIVSFHRRKYSLSMYSFLGKLPVMFWLFFFWQISTVFVFVHWHFFLFLLAEAGNGDFCFSSCMFVTLVPCFGACQIRCFFCLGWLHTRTVPVMSLLVFFFLAR